MRRLDRTKYLKQMNESILQEFICKLNDSKLVAEADDAAKEKVKQVEDNIRDQLKDVTEPEDVERYLSANEGRYKSTYKELKQKDKKKAGLLKKAWIFLIYAVRKGLKFIVDNWTTIMQLLFILALAIVSKTVFGWLIAPIKQYFDTYGKNGEYISQSNAKFSSYAEKVANTAAHQWMLGGGLR